MAGFRISEFGNATILDKTTPNFYTNTRNIIANLERPPAYPQHLVLTAFRKYQLSNTRQFPLKTNFKTRHAMR